MYLRWKLESATEFAARVICKTQVEDVQVSTVFTPDLGYETAICDEESTYPVERYKGLADAEVGHLRWVVEMKKRPATIVVLAYPGVTQAETVTLVRS